MVLTGLVMEDPAEAANANIANWKVIHDLYALDQFKGFSSSPSSHCTSFLSAVFCFSIGGHGFSSSDKDDVIGVCAAKVLFFHLPTCLIKRRVLDGNINSSYIEEHGE